MGDLFGETHTPDVSKALDQPAHDQPPAPVSPTR